MAIPIPLFFFLSGRFPDCLDAEGRYFIDRDPRYFGLILNWLRDPVGPDKLPWTVSEREMRPGKLRKRGWKKPRQSRQFFMNPFFMRIL